MISMVGTELKICFVECVVTVSAVMSGGSPKCDENTNGKFLSAAVCLVLDIRIRYMLPK
jgi:hypothetical protein